MSDLSAFLAAVEVGQREAKMAARRVREEGNQIDRASRLLEQAKAALDGGRREQPASKASPGRKRSAKPRRTNAKRPAALERMEAMRRYVVEAPGPVAAGEVRRALGFTESTTQRGLGQLYREKKVKRTGVGSATRYRARGATVLRPRPSKGGSSRFCTTAGRRRSTNWHRQRGRRRKRPNRSAGSWSARTRCTWRSAIAALCSW